MKDVPTLLRALESTGFHQKTPSTFESNTLYDNPTGIFAEPESSCAFASTAITGVLTHKSRGTAGKHKTRVEHETAVANGDQMHAILTALGLRPILPL